VWFSTAARVERDSVERELAAIRTQGFNAIRVAVGWADAEPTRGTYRFDAVDRVFEVAASADLRVILQLDTAVPPAWLLGRYPDGRLVTDATPAENRQRACLDHPDVRAEALRFVGAASERFARQPSWYALDVGSDLPLALCRCAFTQRRYREWAKAGKGDSAAFVAETLRDHLELLVGGSKARGARLVTSHSDLPSVVPHPQSHSQDDWLMGRAVDRYGTSMTAGARAETPSSSWLALAFDGIRSATREQGWWMGTDISDPEIARLWSWAAVSRGASGLTFGKVWRGAGALASVITRNPSLFAPLRPRPSTIAIAYDPHVRGNRPSVDDSIYRVLFERNLQTDFIHADEIEAGGASRYRAVVLSSALSSPRVMEALNAYVAGGGTLIDQPAAKLSAEDLGRRIERAGIKPDVRIEGGNGSIETRFLESPDVSMLIGLNYSDIQQRVTLIFTADTQEAIWQNMETGSGVNFVAGADGPTYAHTFRPHETLVLMIKKSVR
jgi:hypothetical protein